MQTTTPLDVVVIGAGQAGLAIGWHLQQQGASFAILDGAPELGHSWRTRWDSLSLFTPGRFDALPGTPFPGDPDHYPSKDEVADYLRDYAAAHQLPVQLGMPVSRLARSGDRFVVETPQAAFDAAQVVVATGAFQVPVVPDVAAGLGAGVTQVHSSAYRNPSQVPAGPVLVVGAGNSGLQIAQELAATNPVTVAVGAKPRTLPQRFLGRDIFWWLTRTGMVTRPADSLLARRVRARGELVIGTRLEDLRRSGVEFCGRVVSASGEVVATADGRTLRPASVVWATGFRSDWSWIDVAGFTTDGGVTHQRGVTTVHGLYFLGLPWQHSRGSALLGFVKEDAEFVADHLAVRAKGPRAGSRRRTVGPATRVRPDLASR
jgi:putative flavoprotein involved in K+ transport